MSAALRVLSNVGIISGQCVLLFVSRDAGLWICLVTGALSLPFYWKNRMWDVVTLSLFMSAINVAGLFFHGR